MAYSQFHDGFWTDPEIRGLSSEDKMVLVWFITNPYRHYSGLYFFEFDSIAKQTGLSEKTVRKGIDTLLEQKFIKYNLKFSIVWVIKMARHEVVRGEKSGEYSLRQTKGIANHLETLHKCPLIREFLAYYQDMDIPYQYPIRQEEEETEEKEKTKTESEPKVLKDTPPPRKPKKSQTSLPDDFGISEAVKTWADKNGHTRLDERLESFRDYALSNGKTYFDWDAAFRRAIKEDWAKLNGGNGQLIRQPQPRMSKADEITLGNLAARDRLLKKYQEQGE